MHLRRRHVLGVGLLFLLPLMAWGQIDPIRRDLVQIGYNAAFEGHAPLSAYAFYYRNQPDFMQTNLTLRLAVAPTYLDSELGISHALGENTDIGVGIAGGGFADSYNEIRQGKFLPEESFDAYSAQGSLSIYHLFNPGQLIPLNGVLRGIVHYDSYDTGPETDPNFKLPADMATFSVRTGVRWGGREPTLYPALAMELSAWYEGDFRSRADTYGYNDRSVSPQSHLFWGEAYLAYSMTNLHQRFSINITAGSSVDADRFSAYRLGGFLPLVGEFPLSLPGYYYQEITAKEFALFGGNYIFALDKEERWNLTVTAATAFVDYLPGLAQPGSWNSGVGGGVFYTSRTWRVMLSYGYGIDAIRSGERGAHSIGFLVQFDLSPAKEAYFKPEQPGHWQGLQRILGVFGS